MDSSSALFQTYSEGVFSDAFSQDITKIIRQIILDAQLCICIVLSNIND